MPRAKKLAPKKAKKKSPKKSNVHLEIERKFLMRRLPVELLSKRKHEIIDIKQYYFEIDGKWQRFRIASDKKGTKYIHTIKKSISPGVYEEDEKLIEKKDFQKIFVQHKKNYRVIDKTRYVIKHQGLKFEIDEYKNLSLVVLEIELPRLNFCFNYPPGLENDMVYELTGIKQFSNLSLALKHNN